METLLQDQAWDLWRKIVSLCHMTECVANSKYICNGTYEKLLRVEDRAFWRYSRRVYAGKVGG